MQPWHEEMARLRGAARTWRSIAIGLAFGLLGETVLAAWFAAVAHVRGCF